MCIFRRRKNAFLELSSTFKASSCLKWVFNYKEQKEKNRVICTLKVDKLEQFLKFKGNLFHRSGAATEKDLVLYDCRLDLFWFNRNAELRGTKMSLRSVKL